MALHRLYLRTIPRLSFFSAAFRPDAPASLSTRPFISSFTHSFIFPALSPSQSRRAIHMPASFLLRIQKSATRVAQRQSEGAGRVPSDRAADRLRW